MSKKEKKRNQRNMQNLSLKVKYSITPEEYTRLKRRVIRLSI